MQENTHTPGPWIKSQVDPIGWAGLGMVDISSRGDSSTPVCSIVGDSRSVVANAALISAAPEMYEALEEIRGFGLDERTSALLSHALAKAEGR